MNDLNRRLALKGLGVGALALLASRAQADTPFSGFSFSATGAPTARTMRDRLAEIINVKDFGAKGDGATDDRAAIQAAFDAREKAGIFFPPGAYSLSRGISLSDTSVLPHRSYSVVGAVQGSTLVIGNFPGALFGRSLSPNGLADMTTFEKLALVNNHLTAGECIKTYSHLGYAIRDCQLRAWRPVQLLEDINSASIDGCQFKGSGPPDPRDIVDDSCGVVTRTNNTSIRASDFNGYGNCIRVALGANISGCRIETCHTGIVVGRDENGGSLVGNVTVSNNSHEANWTAIHLAAASASVFHNFGIQGQPFTPQPQSLGGGIGNSKYGINIELAGQLSISSVAASGAFSAAGIAWTGLTSPYSVFAAVKSSSDGGGVGWRLHSDMSGVTFLGCDQPSR